MTTPVSTKVVNLATMLGMDGGGGDEVDGFVSMVNVEKGRRVFEVEGSGWSCVVTLTSP